METHMQTPSEHEDRGHIALGYAMIAGAAFYGVLLASITLWVLL